ncbi:unnamed protein product [Candidula unifasciata]|uniref:Glutathione S-transferase n=1 Tax=Candidula unifasciata TaxID=100452 RepID=A0A8S3ZT68_9EUPU|nr:unnamed protein product [Candidula unifasciata]
MPELKLYYFNGGNRVLVSRLILAAAGVDYEFIQVTRDTWPEQKSTFPFGQLPALSVDGKRFGQSIAIQAYLAREYGLYGSNNIQRLEIDQLVQLREDFSRESHLGPRDRDPEKKAEREKHLSENVYPLYLGYFRKFLLENGTGFAVGDQLSLADLVLYEATSSLVRRNAELLQKYPEILAHREKVEELPRIREFLATSGETARV